MTKDICFCNCPLDQQELSMLVYRVTNTLTGKSYIGITKGKLGRRLKNHFSAALRHEDIIVHKHVRGRKFYNAIRKYSPDAWQADILEIVETQAELLNKEILYIKALDTYRNGYNETAGGEGVYGLPAWNLGAKTGLPAWNRGVPQSAEAKQKQRLAMLGKPGLSGENNPRFGKASHNNRRVKAIDVLSNEIIGSYPSLTKCAEALPISHASVKKILAGVFTSIKGITVCYE